LAFPNAAGTFALTSDLASYQPLDTDLTTFGGLSCSTGQIPKIAGGVWVCGTDDTIGGGAVTGTGVDTRVALWSGTSTQDSDTGLTFNRTTDTLTTTTFVGA
jgi:hypothetical protein